MSADNCTVVARWARGGQLTWGVWNNQSMSSVCEEQWEAPGPPDVQYEELEDADKVAADMNDDEYHEYGVVTIDD